MSLEGIFDPMVRAYFAENDSDGGSSAELNKLKAEGGVGYSEYLTTEEIVPEAVYEFYDGLLQLPATQRINSGDEVVTIIDGTEYKATAKTTLTSIGELAGAGNFMLFGNEDTGEPYLFAVLEQEGSLVAMIIIYSEGGSVETTHHTVSVSINVMAVHTIAPQYIPNTAMDITDIIKAVSGSAEDLPAFDENRLNVLRKGIEQKNLILTANTDGASATYFPTMMFKGVSINNSTGEHVEAYYVALNYMRYPYVYNALFTVTVTASGVNLGWETTEPK